MKDSMRKPHKDQPAGLTVAALAERLGCPFRGRGDVRISGVASLESARPGDLVFLAHPKHRRRLEATQASAAIVPAAETFDRIPVILAQDPRLSFIHAVSIFLSPSRPQPGLHPGCQISPTAKIGRNVSVGAFAVIGDDVEIGDGTVIHPLVVVYPGAKIGPDCVLHSLVSIRERVTIGRRVVIHSGAVLGSDGFGYAKAEDGSLVKIPQLGTVVVEDDVEIGANATIDRASLDATIIRRGTKIDNLVMIAHNVEIGPGSVLAAQTGIAGSSRFGKSVIAAGQVGIADHVSVGDGVIIAAKSGVTKDIPDGSIVAGSPHLDIRDWRKCWVLLPRLQELIKDVRRMKKKIEELEKKT